ncbi:hypothetical protein [Streptomyces violaceus]|uniref:Uncharacterized protein n=1 Tax=Streptomyces violaceus TaxID=1936 RepID=A0ABZ1NLL9_STRVL
MTDQPALDDLDAEPVPERWCCAGNAEDCPLYDTATLPYPWICPGHPDTVENRARAQAESAPRSLHAAIAAAIRDTPARYPDDIAAAVLNAPELQQLLAQAARDQRQIARVRTLAAELFVAGATDTHRSVGRQLLNALQPPVPGDDGPSVRECAKTDAAHWADKYAGEGQ